MNSKMIQLYWSPPKLRGTWAARMNLGFGKGVFMEHVSIV